MDCPRCNTPLKHENVNEFKVTFEVDTCHKCGGTWFDNGELSHLDKIIEPTYFEIRKIPKQKEQLKALSCPACGKLNLLQKAEHHRDSKVIMDYCPSCKGIWLDKGELEAIQKENWLTTFGRMFKWLLGQN